jgi:hypothetical protein
LREELRKPAAGLLFQPIAPTREFCSTAVPDKAAGLVESLDI